MAARRIKRTRRGFDVRLPGAERDLLRGLPEQLGTLLDEGERRRPRDAAAVSLGAPGRRGRVGRVRRGSSRDDLTDGDVARSRRWRARSTRGPLTEDELLAWLAVINDLRLVLGVRLAVTEETVPSDFDGDEEAAGLYAVYAYLSYLEEEIVERARADG